MKKIVPVAVLLVVLLPLRSAEEMGTGVQNATGAGQQAEQANAPVEQAVPQEPDAASLVTVIWPNGRGTRTEWG